MVKLIEVVNTHRDGFSLREVYINPSHVVFLREDIHMKSRLTEGLLPEGIDTRQRFTKIQLRNGSTGTEFVVVGDPNLVEIKLKGTNREILNG